MEIYVAFNFLKTENGGQTRNRKRISEIRSKEKTISKEFALTYSYVNSKST